MNGPDRHAIDAATRATYAAFVGMGFAVASWASRIPQVKQQLDLDSSELGLVLLAMAAGSVIALPLSGPVVTRFGARAIVSRMATVAGAGLVTIAFGCRIGVAPVVVGLFALGVGTGSWDVAMNVHGAAVERHRARAIMPRFHAGFSIGAVAGAVLLPRVRALISRDTLVAGASALYALAALALAHLPYVSLLAVAMVATGVAWISILSALQVSAQMTLPSWVRARGLAAFVVVFMGGMAIGSVLWGQVATHVGIPAALTTAALAMLAAIGLTWRFKLGHHEVLDFRPSMDWPMPLLAETPEPDGGPVMVTISYRVQLEKRTEFVTAMSAVREMRRRNGAYFWELFH